MLDIGIDIIDNNKFDNFDENQIKRFLTSNEYNEYLLVHENYKKKYLASRWCAKEAIFKAIKNKIKINLINIEILYFENKIPYCTNIKNIMISISHSDLSTVCVAIFNE